MGIFGSNEQIAEVSGEPPGSVSEHVSGALPDIGDYFLEWCGLPQSLTDELEEKLNSLRTEAGPIPLNRAVAFGIGKWENGPLTFLTKMTVFDRACLEVWATYGLSGSAKRNVKEGVVTVLGHSGHAAAATWAFATRPNSKQLYLDLLSDSLVTGWQRQVSDVTQGDMIKACKRWRRE